MRKYLGKWPVTMPTVLFTIHRFANRCLPRVVRWLMLRLCVQHCAAGKV